MHFTRYILFSHGVPFFLSSVWINLNLKASISQKNCLSFATFEERRSFVKTILSSLLESNIKSLFKMSSPITVCVTGAAGQIAYSLLYSIAKGDVFGPVS